MTKSIAETLNDSIEHHLWCGKRNSQTNRESHTCLAVYLAANPYAIAKSYRFIRELGWPMLSADAFDEFEHGPKRQYARALALTFAEMIAREEGL